MQHMVRDTAVDDRHLRLIRGHEDPRKDVETAHGVAQSRHLVFENASETSSRHLALTDRARPGCAIVRDPIGIGTSDDARPALLIDHEDRVAANYDEIDLLSPPTLDQLLIADDDPVVGQSCFQCCRGWALTPADELAVQD